MRLCCGARLREMEKRRPRGELPGPAGGAGKLGRDSWSGLGGQDEGQQLEPDRGEASGRNWEEILPSEGAEGLAQAAQRSWRCPSPGSAQDQAGGDWGQPGVMGGVPNHGMLELSGF